MTTTEKSIHAHLHHKKKKKKKLHHITGDVMAHEGLFSNSMTEFNFIKLIELKCERVAGGIQALQLYSLFHLL